MIAVGVGVNGGIRAVDGMLPRLRVYVGLLATNHVSRLGAENGAASSAAKQSVWHPHVSCCQPHIHVAATTTATPCRDVALACGVRRVLHCIDLVKARKRKWPSPSSRMDFARQV